MNVVVLAAGMGKRMHSDLPKVMHPIAGRPMLAHVIDTAKALSNARITVVIGHRGERVREAFTDPSLQWVTQEPQLGTGHAVQQAVAHLSDDAPTLVLYGDVPLTRIDTLRSLSNLASEGSTLAILTVRMDDPTGYGRVVRSADGRTLVAIVEEKDATPEQFGLGSQEKTLIEKDGATAEPRCILRGWPPRGNAHGFEIVARVVLA